MQRLEVSGAVRPLYGSLGENRLIHTFLKKNKLENKRFLTEYKQALPDFDLFLSSPCYDLTR